MVDIVQDRRNFIDILLNLDLKIPSFFLLACPAVENSVVGRILLQLDNLLYFFEEVVCSLYCISIFRF